MRAFIAIDLPKELDNKISNFQNQLKKTGTFEGSWTKEREFTLKFLGEINETQVSEISKVLNQICNKTKKFELELFGLGVFPSLNNIRVFWIGACKGDEAAKELQTSIDKELGKIGFVREKRDYKNHLTLIRVKKFDKQKCKELLEKYSDKSFGKFTVSEIKLIKSKLTREGPSYELIQGFRLA